MHTYPVQACELKCEDYCVRLNGADVTLDSARVSAMPFNRRWPGHQRQIEQTELCNFLSFCVDSPVEIEVIPNRPFDPEKVQIRPASLGITPAVSDGVIRFTLPHAAYFTLEPWGRHGALHFFADPPAEYSYVPDEKTRYFAPGVHEAGLIELKSGETLYIDEGALVYGRVLAEDADDISILGRGILDNSREKETILFEINAENNDADVGNASRTHTVELRYCDRVKIEGITIRDSLCYNIKPSGCRDMEISHVKLIGNWRFNSDGIDMHNCERVYIHDCFLRTFDDSICIKGFDFFYAADPEQATRDAIYHNGQVFDTFKDVLVERCTVWNDWGICLEIGAETRAEEICNITFRDCDVIHTTSLVLDCFNADYAEVHDLVYENIRVAYDDIIPQPKIQKSDSDVYVQTDPDYSPMLLSARVSYNAEYSDKNRRGINRDITFRNIYLTGRQLPRLRFTGFDAEHETYNVRVENLWHNGVLIESLPQDRIVTNEFTHNVELFIND